jgi:hypothetical protein
MIERKHLFMIIPIVLAIVAVTSCVGTSTPGGDQSLPQPPLTGSEEFELLKQLWGKDITEAEYEERVNPEALERMPKDRVKHERITKLDWAAIVNAAIDCANFPERHREDPLLSATDKEQIEILRGLRGKDISVGEVFEQVFPKTLEVMPAKQVERLYATKMNWDGFDDESPDHCLKCVKVSVFIGPPWQKSAERDTFTSIIGSKLAHLVEILAPLFTEEQIGKLNELRYKDVTITDVLEQVCPEALEDMPEDLFNCLNSIKMSWGPQEPEPACPSLTPGEDYMITVIAKPCKGLPCLGYQLFFGKQPNV